MTKQGDISANKSAIAGIGEGVAGLLGQRLYHGKKKARPNHDFPDILMESGDNLFLVESKARSESVNTVKRDIDKELPRMTSFVSSCSDIDSRPIRGLLIGTHVMRELHPFHFLCFITEVQV